jgi:hypothetical protein
LKWLSSYTPFSFITAFIKTDSNTMKLFKSLDANVQLNKSTKVFQALGLQFFSIDSSLGDEKLSKDFSTRQKTTFGIVIFLVLLELCGTFLLMWIEKEKKPDKNLWKALVVQVLGYMGTSVAILTAVLNGFLNVDKAKEIFRKFQGIFKTFEGAMGVKVNLESFAEKFKGICMRLHLTFIGSSILHTIFTIYHNNPHVVSWACLSVFNQYFNRLILLQFIFMTLLVKEILIKVLESMQKLQSCEDSKSSQEEKNQKFLKTANNLKKIYAELCETTEMINDFFGVSITIPIILSIVSIISGGYKVRQSACHCS